MILSMTREADVFTCTASQTIGWGRYASVQWATDKGIYDNSAFAYANECTQMNSLTAHMMFPNKRNGFVRCTVRDMCNRHKSYTFAYYGKLFIH